MNEAQILPWRVLSLRRKSRNPNSGSFSEVLELFPTDELLWVNDTGDEKASSDLRSQFLVALYLQKVNQAGLEAGEGSRPRGPSWSLESPGVRRMVLGAEPSPGNERCHQENSSGRSLHSTGLLWDTI